jgi:beta-lactamase regulating signal transducer with metallopeptidase domain
MIVCAGILYANYYALLRNNRFHSYNRYYLLAATVLSILVPFVHIPVDFNTSQVKPAAIWQTLTAISSVTGNKNVQIPSENIATLFTLKNILSLFYILIASTILTRFVTAFIFIRKLLQRYKVERTGNIYFVSTEEPGTPFSFFKWLFWNDRIQLQSDNGQQMFRHELFHIQQRHSWDLAFLELTTALFWINPFFHLIKKEVKTIHEFLADEFATKENDKWNYAELLLMQVLGSSSHRLVNPFFHNQIKRRIAMITSSKTPKYQFFRKLMILPIAALVFVLFAFNIKYHSDKTIPVPNHDNKVADASGESKTPAWESYLSGMDTIKPKEKQKTKKSNDQKEIDKKNNQSENEEFQKLMEEKAREAQQGQERLKQLMEESQKEIVKHQEEFKKMMEMNQREAQENQEKLKLLLEQRQKEAANYQEEFKKMMEGKERQAQQEGQEKFKQLMEERQKEAEKFQQQFKEMLGMKQKESERSQQELKKLLEERQQQMQELQEDIKKKIILMQQEAEKAKKQVI